jgi:hypothetical protein
LVGSLPEIALNGGFPFFGFWRMAETNSQSKRPYNILFLKEKWNETASKRMAGEPHG